MIRLLIAVVLASMLGCEAAPRGHEVEVKPAEAVARPAQPPAGPATKIPMH
jgi:hypothetical protein